jgi:hypothetical protein
MRRRLQALTSVHEWILAVLRILTASHRRRGENAIRRGAAEQDWREILRRQLPAVYRLSLRPHALG